MKIIDQIIIDLTDDKKSLNSALLKTKVLAHKINNSSFITWLNNEMNGYKKILELPDYRILPAYAVGTISNGYQRGTNVPIPTMNLEPEFQDFMTRSRITNSVSNLEFFINDQSNNEMAVKIPPELCAHISRTFESGYVLEIGKVVIAKNLVVELVNNVRSKLLEFILEIKNDFNSEEDFIGEEKEIEKLFGGTIIGNYNTFISGNNNTQNVNIKISQGDFRQLSNILKQHKVDENEIQELDTILQNEKPDVQKREYGPKIKKWISKMLSKSVEGTWKIGVDVAGKLITEVLKQYYGF